MRLDFTAGSMAGQTVELVESPATLGRAPENQLSIPDARIARLHARFERGEDGRWQLTDLDSGDGTFVNGWRITGSVVLQGGEELRFGGHTAVARVSVATDGRGGGALGGAAPRPPPTYPPTPPPEQMRETERPPTEPEHVLSRADHLAPERPEFADTSPAGADQAQTPPRERPAQRQRRLAMATFIRTTEQRLRRHTIFAVAAVGVAVVAVVLAVSGVFSGGGKEVREIVTDAQPSTVLVIRVVDGERLPSGTGWVFDADEGLVVTAAHVTGDSEEFGVALGGDIRTAELVAAHCNDIALLRVDDTDGMRSMPLGNHEEISEGDSVVAIGYPDSLSEDDNLVTTTGVVSVAKTSAVPFEGLAYPNVIQVDAAVNPGNSGGPLLDLEGRLIGMNTFGHAANQNQNYAIAVDHLQKLLPELRDGRSTVDCD